MSDRLGGWGRSVAFIEAAAGFDISGEHRLVADRRQDASVRSMVPKQPGEIPGRRHEHPGVGIKEQTACISGGQSPRKPLGLIDGSTLRGHGEDCCFWSKRTGQVGGGHVAPFTSGALLHVLEIGKVISVRHDSVVGSFEPSAHRRAIPKLGRRLSCIRIVTRIVAAFSR